MMKKRNNYEYDGKLTGGTMNHKEFVRLTLDNIESELGNLYNIVYENMIALQDIIKLLEKCLKVPSDWYDDYNKPSWHTGPCTSKESNWGNEYGKMRTNKKI